MKIFLHKKVKLECTLLFLSWQLLRMSIELLSLYCQGFEIRLDLIKLVSARKFAECDEFICSVLVHA